MTRRSGGDWPSAEWIPAALAVLVLFLLRDFVFGDAVFYKRDIHAAWHPQVEAFVRAVAEGSWPLWDPSPGFGQPLLADPSAQILYPFTWLNLVLPPWTYYTVFVAAHAWFSACGMALLARRQGLSPAAGLLAGSLWLLSAPFVSLFDLWHHFASAAWMPWVMLAAEQAFASRRPRSAVLFGVAAGFQLLAGSADVAMMTALLVAADLATRHVSWRRAAGPENRRLLLAAALAVAVAVGLAAGSWFTAAAASRGTLRWTFAEQSRTYWSVHPIGALEVLLPWKPAALPLAAEWHAKVSESREPFLASLYLGVGTWALAALAFGLAGRDRRVLVLALAGLAALLIALGRHAPFYEVLVNVLPPLRVLRYPVKAMVLVAFATSLCAGHGLDRWRGGARPLPAIIVLVLVAVGAAAMVMARAPIAHHLLRASVPDRAAALAPAVTSVAAAGVVAVLLLALALFPRSRPGVAADTGALAGLVAVADLAVRHRQPSPAAPGALYRERPAVLELLRRTPQARAFVYDYTIYNPQRRHPALRVVPEGWTAGAAAALASQISLSPETAGRWRVDTGWNVDGRGLFPLDLARLGGLALSLEGDRLHRLLRLGGITHVIAFHEEGFDRLQPLATLPTLWNRPLRVYTVPDPLPRTYAVGAARAVGGGTPIDALFEPGFDPSREVILDRVTTPPFAFGPVGASRVVERRADRVVLEAEMEAPGYVVLLDGFAEGWRARIDGRPAALLRANAVFRAVAVPPGRHRIEMTYRPSWCLIGLGLSAATAAAGAIFLFRTRHRAATP